MAGGGWGTPEQLVNALNDANDKGVLDDVEMGYLVDVTSGAYGVNSTHTLPAALRLAKTMDVRRALVRIRTLAGVKGNVTPYGNGDHDTNAYALS